MVNTFSRLNPKHKPILTDRFNRELKTYYDDDLQALWMQWNPHPRPCYTLSLLKEIEELHDLLKQNNDCLYQDNICCPVRYLVASSKVPGVYNLGGDLEYFEQCIKAQDYDSLWQYGHAAMLAAYRTYTLPGIMAIALVQGHCLGGGFEAALACHTLVAERSATFGFPEIKFNLFPGMGAYSFLERRVGHKLTNQLLCEGKIYSAEEMHAMGLIDVLVEDGEGVTAVENLIKQCRNYHSGLMAIAQVRRRVQRLDYEEMRDILSVWVDAALCLTPRDLKLMCRIVGRQYMLKG
ncbi:MAG TPA: crotonase/enoyl-CoA hydratase family protein [Trichocoleus sp.]